MQRRKLLLAGPALALALPLRANPNNLALIGAAIPLITEQAANQGAAFAELQDAHEQLTAQFADLQKQHADLLAQLDLTPQHNHTQRPPATGGAGTVLTDC